MDHYARLGVDPTASQEQIREAYRSAARRHHPDTAGGDARTMAEVNEAWRVLGDPWTRRQYDTTRTEPRAQPAAGPPSGGHGAPSAPTYAPTPVPKVPWRLLGGMAAVGIAVVLVGVVTYDAPTPLGPDNLLQSGSCVDIQPNGDAAEVACDGPHDGVVDQLIPFDGTCRPPAVPHRDRQGMGVACVLTDPVGGG